MGQNQPISSTCAKGGKIVASGGHFNQKQGGWGGVGGIFVLTSSEGER